MKLPTKIIGKQGTNPNPSNVVHGSQPRGELLWSITTMLEPDPQGVATIMRVISLVNRHRSINEGDGCPHKGLVLTHISINNLIFCHFMI